MLKSLALLGASSNNLSTAIRTSCHPQQYAAVCNHLLATSHTLANELQQKQQHPKQPQQRAHIGSRRQLPAHFGRHFNTHLAADHMVANRDLAKLLSKAEKIVGYPTSFLSLRYLVSDEAANFANLLRKLMQTKHPLINMLRKLISSSGGVGGGDNDADLDAPRTKRSLQINGLVVLLIAKAAGVPLRLLPAVSSGADDNTSTTAFACGKEGGITDGIHISQRCLAEITEMIYMAFIIHKGVLDLRTVSAVEYNDMNQGNKLAVLCGDFLLASACNNLAKLHNTQVVDLMSQVIGDLSSGLFEHDPDTFKLTSLQLWYDDLNSTTTSLLANSAKSVMLLVKHSQETCEAAWHFAKHLDITYKIWSELSDFKANRLRLNEPRTILNAVLLDRYSSSKQPSLSSSAAVFDECKSLLNEHYEQAMISLDELDNDNSEKEAIASLKSILIFMRDSI